MNIISSLINKIKKGWEVRRSLALIKSSGLFDEIWYLANNMDVAKANAKPMLHYLSCGGFEGRDPSPNFNSAWYLAMNEDVNKAGINPLVHYLRYGLKEGREGRPHQPKIQATRWISQKPAPTDYEKWIVANEPSSKDLEIQRSQVKTFSHKPLISVIMAAWNTPAYILDQTTRSVVVQTYEHWQMCIADGNSGPETKKVLLSLIDKDPRINVKFLDENKGIAANLNEALSIAQGEFVAFLDHDDMLAPFALFEVIARLQIEKDVDVIYSDEDKVDEEDKRVSAFFKPDFSPDYLRGVNYMPHLLVVRKSLGDQIGWFREGFEGAQDYDLILRLVEKARSIVHIPKILYHWRLWSKSTAGGIDAKPYANISGKKALSDHLNRIGLSAEVKDGFAPTFYHPHYRIPSTPLISVIIPNFDHITELERCVNSIIKNSTYQNYEIIIVENGSKDKEIFRFYEQLKVDPRVHVLKWHKPFNLSRLNNWAARAANGDLYLFLSNYTQVINNDWLEQMLQFAMRPDVGAVGAKLYYPDGTVEHGGIIVGIGGTVGYSHKHFPRDDSGYFGQLVLPHNVSAIAGDCLLVRRQVFQEVNGFDENLAHLLWDVSLCLSILKKGYLNVWTPYAELYHYNSEKLGLAYAVGGQYKYRKEIKYFKHNWDRFLQKGDPYYSPNLTLDSEDYTINLAGIH